MPPRFRNPPPWHPREQAIGRRIARHKRLVRNGLAPAGDKASLRAAAEDAARSHPIRKVP